MQHVVFEFSFGIKDIIGAIENLIREFNSIVSMFIFFLNFDHCAGVR